MFSAAVMGGVSRSLQVFMSLTSVLNLWVFSFKIVTNRDGTYHKRLQDERVIVKFLFMEPFFGGSHRNFAEGLKAHSQYEIDLVTLPARFWKWRMRGAALHFVPKIQNLEDYDGLIASDLMSLADFKAITGSKCPPALVYFHESQMTYPLPPGETMDVHFGFTDMTTALCADRILFNSHFHFDAFFEALPKFLKMMPDYRPKWVIKKIRTRAGVLHPGVEAGQNNAIGKRAKGGPPLIIWNHRWEFDKNPEAFFSALYKIEKKGIPFRLALLGENFKNCPKIFQSARRRLRNRIVHYGYVPDRTEYERWLNEGDIVISTARQENFGISVVEAIMAGCVPFLPCRLSYPELIPEPYQKHFIYQSQKQLIEKLTMVLSDRSCLKDERTHLALEMARFSWKHLAPVYDRELEQLACLR